MVVNGRFLFKFQSAVRPFFKFQDHLTTSQINMVVISRFFYKFEGGGGGVQAYNFGNFEFEIRVEEEGQDTSQLF